jgi:hypothetical protein
MSSEAWSTSQMANVREVVALMVELVSGGSVAFEEQHGGAALETAQEIEAALMARLEGSLGHVVLWEQFLRTPETMADAAGGVIQRYAAQDPVLATWLEDALARCKASARDKQG